jgi:general secretion pathway protein G
MYKPKMEKISGPTRKPAFSLLEVSLAVSLMGIIAGVVMPRLTSHSKDVRIHACHVYRGNIEIQAELWFRNRGKWPAADLNDIGNAARYFPDGLPSCPVDDSHYSIDTNSGRVNGHKHDK